MSDMSSKAKGEADPDWYNLNVEAITRAAAEIRARMAEEKAQIASLEGDARTAAYTNIGDSLSEISEEANESSSKRRDALYEIGDFLQEEAAAIDLLLLICRLSPADLKPCKSS